MKHRSSTKLFTRAQKSIPGGVNSPVRAFRSVGGRPLFIKKAKGSRIWDADGNSFIDYVLSWGPMILGHANPKIIGPVKTAASRGTSFGAPTDLEVQLAELIRKAFPSMERVRLVSSGTEAAMSALRLARGYTKRNKILKFEGCYHGHSDSLLVRAGSGLATFGVPDSPGVPADLARLTLNAPYNDAQAVRKIFEQHGSDIAAVIVEPVAGNMGVVPPEEGFLENLREITARYGSVLIFDEVITGFRVSYGGAQKRFGVWPDMTCLGKIIGGGLPVGAFGGSREIMEQLSPSGPVYQAGTLSGNPLAVTAGIQMLKLLKQPGVYKKLEERSKQLAEGIGDAARRAGIAVTQTRVGSMLGLFFTDRPVSDFNSASTSNTKMFSRYFWEMLNQGIYLAPSQFEAAFVSTAHSKSDIGKTVRAAFHAFKRLA